MLAPKALLVCDVGREPCDELVLRLRRAGYEVIVHDAPGYDGLDFDSPRLYVRDITATGVEGIEELAAQLEVEFTEQHGEFITRIQERLQSIESIEWNQAEELLGKGELEKGVQGGAVIVLQGECDRIPVFQIDIDNHRLRSEVMAVNKVLGAGTDPFGVLSWWVDENESTGGEAPVAMLGRDEDALLAVAIGSIELGG